MRITILSTFLLFFLLSCGSNTNETTDNSSASNDTPATTEPVEPEKPSGQKVYRTYCITCHGMDGQLGLNGAKDLSVSELPIEERILQITEGKNLMTPFKGILSEDQIQAVAEYTQTLKQ